MVLGRMAARQGAVPRREDRRLGLRRILDRAPAGQRVLHAPFNISGKPECGIEQFDRLSRAFRMQIDDRRPELKRIGELRNDLGCAVLTQVRILIDIFYLISENMRWRTNECSYRTRRGPRELCRAAVRYMKMPHS